MPPRVVMPDALITANTGARSAGRRDGDTIRLAQQKTREPLVIHAGLVRAAPDTNSASISAA